MLKNIMDNSSKTALYKHNSQGKNRWIGESLDSNKKRFPAYRNDKMIAVADIAMYTDDDEVPLREVFESIKTKENGEAVSLDTKKAKPEELRAFLAEVLPNFDRDRVYVTDIKKLIQWYNILIANGIGKSNEIFSQVRLIM